MDTDISDVVDREERSVTTVPQKHAANTYQRICYKPNRTMAREQQLFKITHRQQSKFIEVKGATFVGFIRRLRTLERNAMENAGLLPP